MSEIKSENYLSFCCNKFIFRKSIGRNFVCSGCKELVSHYKDMELEETWKDIPGYEGLYQASDLGRIKSLDRIVETSNMYSKLYKGTILKQTLGTTGYLTVKLNTDGKRKTRKVHQLIAMAFLSHKPCGHDKVINHKDFDKTNNNINNLEITTTRENIVHKTKTLNSSSIYTGVYIDKERGGWISSIFIEGKHKFLGRFESEKEASLCYEETLKNYLHKKQNK